MAAPGFTIEQLMDAIREDKRDLSGFFTTGEWAELLVVQPARMRMILREALARGMVKRDFTFREAIDGSQRRVPVYAFKLKKGKGAEQHG